MQSKCERVKERRRRAGVIGARADNVKKKTDAFLMIDIQRWHSHNRVTLKGSEHKPARYRTVHVERQPVRRVRVSPQKTPNSNYRLFVTPTALPRPTSLSQKAPVCRDGGQRRRSGRKRRRPDRERTVTLKDETPKAFAITRLLHGTPQFVCYRRIYS